jgi:hypothetical protein
VNVAPATDICAAGPIDGEAFRTLAALTKVLQRRREVANPDDKCKTAVP